jgi:hypothetical protein
LPLLLAGLTLFLHSCVPLLPGPVILWLEIGSGIAVNRVAQQLTKRTIALLGLKIEQNTIVKQMLASGDFRLLWSVYAGMIFIGALVTGISIRIGAVWLAIPLLFFTFPLPVAMDALNDVYWMRRFELEAPA